MKRCKDCTGCDKGLEYVAKIIIADNEEKLAKMRLCDSCRKTLTVTIAQTFNKRPRRAPSQRF